MKNNKLDKKVKKEILDSVLKSEHFRKSTKYQELLCYLFNYAVEGEEIKESTIALEFFDKTDVFDPSWDSSVRAYISNLRKKLEHYYLTEGKDDEFQIVLPKGDYQIRFLKSPHSTNSASPSTRGLRVSYFLLVIALFLLITPLVFFWGGKVALNKDQKRYIQKDDLIWGDILNSTKKSLIVLGDYYFFSMPLDSGRHTYMRDVRINSDADLANFLESYPTYKSKASKTYHTYLEEHIAWSLFYIIPSLVHHRKDIELKLSSEVQLEDLQKYNIIYIGPYKSLNQLCTVTRDLDFKYHPSQLDFFDRVENKPLHYSWATDHETQARNDYAMVLKVYGTNDNTFMFFLSQHDIGNISTVKRFSNPQFLEEMRMEIPSGGFEALFEVKGIVRTDFEIRLLHVNELHSKFEINIR